MIKIDGITEQALDKIIDFYAPKNVIDTHLWNEQDELYDITINNDAIIKINTGNITIDLGGVLYTVDRYDYISLTVL